MHQVHRLDTFEDIKRMLGPRTPKDKLPKFGNEAQLVVTNDQIKLHDSDSFILSPELQESGKGRVFIQWCIREVTGSHDDDSKILYVQ